jgi:hypothetical protein
MDGTIGHGRQSIKNTLLRNHFKCLWPSQRGQHSDLLSINSNRANVNFGRHPSKMCPWKSAPAVGEGGWSPSTFHLTSNKLVLPIESWCIEVGYLPKQQSPGTLPSGQRIMSCFPIWCSVFPIPPLPRHDIRCAGDPTLYWLGSNGEQLHTISTFIEAFATNAKARNKWTTPLYVV